MDHESFIKLALGVETEIKRECFDRACLTLSRPSHHRRTSLMTSCVSVSSRPLFDIRLTAKELTDAAAGDSPPTHEDRALLPVMREALKTVPKEPW